MASQNYASAVLKKIDERFYLESKTAGIINNGMLIEFNGMNSVTIYNVNIVAETDYIRQWYRPFWCLDRAW
jgi:hypothetical protein